METLESPHKGADPGIRAKNVEKLHEINNKGLKLRL